MPETMNSDDFYLDDANVEGDDEQLAGLKERLRAYRDVARLVLATWSRGDLAAAVRGLAALMENVVELPAGFHEDKAERLLPPHPDRPRRALGLGRKRRPCLRDGQGSRREHDLTRRAERTKEEDDVEMTSAIPDPAGRGGEDARPALVPVPMDPGRLDWFTSAVLPDGGQRVRICRCARSTPTEPVEFDRGTSALQRNPADLRGLAVLGELARADPAVSWPAARQAVLRAFWWKPEDHDPA